MNDPQFWYLVCVVAGVFSLAIDVPVVSTIFAIAMLGTCYTLKRHENEAAEMVTSE